MTAFDKIYSGVDGGGTRTRLLLVDEHGRRLGFAEGGSCSFTEHGLDAARAELSRISRQAWRSAGSEPRPVDSLFMGMGSILAPPDARINCDLAIELGLVAPGHVRAENDAWIAHAGGLEGQPGILLIAGTGSACFGRNARGESWRTGGWGHLLGETGSAHALGQAALIAATRAADGRGPGTTLTEFVREALGLGDLKEIYRLVHQAGVPRARLAGLAPGVVARGASGDLVARHILRQNAEGLAEMVVTVATRLQLENARLALTGGLICNAHEFRQLFLDCLAHTLPGVRLAEDGLAPVFGAVLLAFEQATGTRPPASFLQNLHETRTACSPTP